MPSSRSAPFAQLPHDLLQRVAALLGDEDRLAMLDVCGSWAAAIEAAPALWPTAILTFGPSALNELGLRQADYAGLTDSRSMSTAVDNVFKAIDAEHNAAVAVMEQAAALSPRCRRVRVQGDQQVKTSVVLGIVSVLPLTIVDLEVDIPCADPLPAALTRFRQLQQLSLRTGGLNWQGHGGSFVLHRLVRLALDYRQPPKWKGYYFEDAQVLSLQVSCPAAELSAATRLSSLELRVNGAQHLLAVCNALPALRELSLDLYWCETEHAQQAVDALRQLPSLAVSLGIHSYWGTDTAPQPYYPIVDDWETTEMPPLAGLHLTALRLVGNVALPPDLLQLKHLRSLELHSLFELDAWGDEPWSSLAQLSQLNIIDTMLPDAIKVAAAPRLSEVHASDSPALEADAEFRSQLATLRPDVRITPEPAS